MEALAAAWQELHDTTEQLHGTDHIPQTLDALLADFGEHNTHKLQNILTKAVEKTKDDEKEQGRTATQAARARAAKSYGAAAALLALPTSDSTTIPPEAMRFATQYRLGTATFNARKCACGADSPSITHILSCKHLRGRFVRHDIIVQLLAKICIEAGFTVTTEVMVVEGRQKRMDLVIYTPGGRVWIDVSIVNPLVKSYIKEKDATKVRETQKIDRWDKDAKRNGTRFIPFIVNTFGGLGPQAKGWLEEIASAAMHRNIADIDSRGISLKAWQGQYRWGLAGRIGAAIAHANYCMVEEAKIKSEFQKAPTRILYAPVWARGKEVHRVRSNFHRGRDLYAGGR